VVAVSTSVREPSDDRKIELGTATSRPLIAAAIGLGLLVLAVPVVLGLLAAMRAAPSKDLAPQSSAAPAREQAASWPAPPVPWSQLRDNLPRPVVVEATTPEPVAPEAPKPRPRPVAAVAKPAAPQTEFPAPPPSPVAVALAPTPAKPAEESEKPDAPSFKRRSPYFESELLMALARESREIDLETEKGTSAKILEEAKKAPPPDTGKAATPDDKNTPRPLSKTQPVLELFAKRADLKGLPVRNGADCQAGAKEAVDMQKLSREVRGASAKLSRSRNSGFSLSEAQRHDSELVRLLDHLKLRAETPDEAAARTLPQMLQAEGVGVRLHLVKMLSAIKGDKASVALAQRVVFDLSQEVREAAVKALKERPAKEYRPTLLEGLRYPWAPAADHAAEALVNLDDRDAALDLAGLLDQPDPLAPFQDKDKKWLAPELVRVNHLGNCLLCHAPSFAKDDPVRGVVPERYKPLPVVYYDDPKGDFVRADVTYLKQDFSAVQPVSDHGQWPRQQRFDYLIRKRELSNDEVALLTSTEDTGAWRPATYPQREAVLWALRELTGEDVGDKSEDWRRRLVR
jgi:hypothetical protein